jgi:OOP family OmpA-OmpF porin
VVQCNDKKQKRAELIKCLEPNRRVEIDQVTVERRVK